MLDQSNSQWVTITEAARMLGTTKGTISRLVASKAIDVKESLADRRIKLVNIEQIKKILTP